MLLFKPTLLLAAISTNQLFTSATTKLDLSTDYLPALTTAISIASIDCQTACQPFKDGIELCLNATDTSDFALAKCSCDSNFLQLISSFSVYFLLLSNFL